MEVALLSMGHGKNKEVTEKYCDLIHFKKRGHQRGLNKKKIVGIFKIWWPGSGKMKQKCDMKVKKSKSKVAFDLHFF